MKCKEKQKNGYLVPQRRGGRKPVTHEIFQELVNEICQSLSVCSPFEIFGIILLTVCIGAKDHLQAIARC